MKDIITIDCKYSLPCGRCDKTNELCSLFQPNVTVTTKPDIPVEITTNTTKQNKYSVVSTTMRGGVE